MTLRNKTLVIIGVTLVGLIVALYFISSTILLQEFARLEESDTRRNVQRALDALAERIANLDSLAADYAGWDDTYAFIEDGNEEYIQTNLIDSTFAKNRLNLVALINISGTLVFGKAFDLQTEAEAPLSPDLQKHLTLNSPLLQHPDIESSVSGILLLPEGPMLVASRPILTSEYTGPIRGALIMGRYLDAAEVESLASVTHLSLAVRRIDPQLPQDFQAARSALKDEKQIFVQPLNADTVAGYAALQDVYAEPSLVLRIDADREIYRQGRASVNYLFTLLIVVALVFGVAVVLLLEHLVLSRLARLNKAVTRIGASSDSAARVAMSGQDELASLAGAINGMLAALDRSQAELRTQKQLSENLVNVARATAERPTLEATLQNALNVATTLTGAERGSLFLLDSGGAVTASVLAPDSAAVARSSLIGRVMDKGLAGWVTHNRQAALIADTDQDARWLTLPNQPYAVRSALAVPILSGPALVGIITLLHSAPGRFGDQDLQLMQAAADQMTLAMRNAQIFDAQRRMADRQMTLYEVLRAMSGQLDPDDAARAAVEAVVKFAGWPHVAIILPSDDRRHWVIRAASGSLSISVGLTQPLSAGVIGRAFKTGRTQNVPDVTADPDYIVGQAEVRSEAAVPVRRGERTLGVLNLESDRLMAFDIEDVLLAESLAEAIGLALDNAWLYAETRKYATDLSALYAITRATSRSLAVEDVLAQALSSAMTLLDFEAGLIGIANLDEVDGQKPLRLATQRGLAPVQLEHIQRDGLEDKLVTHIRERRESLVVSDADREFPDTGDIVAEITESGWHTGAGIPLLHQEQLVGVMCLFAAQARISSAYDQALLTTIGHQIAAAVTNARLFQVTMTERSRLQALIKSSRDGVMLIGLDRQLLVINEPALQMLRLPGSIENWVNQPLDNVLLALQVYAIDVATAVEAEINRIQKGDEPPGEGEFEVSPHALHWLNLPVMAGAMPLGRLMVLRDVTDERAVERMREDMTHTMVHDLRNPLTAMFGMVELLCTFRADTLLPDQLSMLTIVRQNTHKMLEMVNGILDVSRLESGRMPVNSTAFSLEDLVIEVFQVQNTLAHEKGICLENDVPVDLPPVWADMGLTRRVLQNLVGNAIKFTPPEGTIRVIGQVVESDGQSAIEVSVQDTGAGIPPEIQNRLFQKFVTGGQEGRGSGLGLAFCKLAVEAHGQRIWVNSEPGQGATFTFSLAANAL